MAEIYTSNAQGNLNTVLGAIGTAGVLTGGSGILGGLFGNNQNYVTKENLQKLLLIFKKLNSLLNN